MLRFDRGSMVVAHNIQCNDDVLGGLIHKEVEKIREQMADELWAQEFAAAMLPTPTVVTPRKNHSWYNRYIVEPHDKNAVS